MKKTKRYLAGILVACMLVTLLPMSAFAAEGNAVLTATTTSATETMADATTKTIYTVMFHVAAPEAIKLLNTVISIDTKMITPVTKIGAGSNKGKFRDVNITDSTSTEKGCFSVLGTYDIDQSITYDVTAVDWFVSETRAAAAYAISTIEAPVNAVEQNMFTFTFRLADGISEEMLTASSLKIETSKTSAMIIGLYPVEANRTFGVRFDGVSEKQYLASEGTASATLTYPGYDRHLLGSLSIGSIADVNVPGTSNNPTVTALDTDGEAMTCPTLTWSIEGTTPPGISIDVATGVLTATNEAQSSTVTIKATSGGKSATQTITITRAAPAATTVTISGGAESIVVPTGDTAATTTFTAKVADQFGVEMTNPTVTWSGTANTTGVSIDASTGIVSVTNAADAERNGITYKVTATCGEKTGTKSVTISRAPQIPTTLTVSGGANEIIVPNDAASGTPATTAAFTAAVVDQYGAAYTGTIDWTITPATAGITIGTDGVVSVTNAAKAAIKNATGIAFTVTATVNGIAVTGNSQTLTVKRATPVTTTVTVTGAADIEVPTDVIAKTETYTAVVTDQYGETMTGESAKVTWSGTTPDPTGVSIATDTDTGIVSVTKDADANRAGITYKVTATCNGKTGTKDVSIKRATAMYTVAVAGGSTSIEVPANDTPATSTEFTATVTDQYGATVTPNITWSITPTKGVSITNGVVSVAQGAKEAIADTNGMELIVTATYMGAAGTGKITVKRAAQSPTTLTVSGGQGSIDVPANNAAENKSAAFTATVVDQYGAAYTKGTIDWTITPATDGITIGTDGVVSVTNAAKTTITNVTGAGYTVTATLKGTNVKGNGQALTVKRATPVATTLTVTGAENIVVPTDVTAKTATYTAVVTDQYGTVTTQAIQWSIAPTAGGTAPDGITIEDGVVKVTKEAKADITNATGIAFTVTAKVNSTAVQGTAAITVKRANPIATTVKIFNGATELADDTLIIPTTDTPNTKQYSAKTYDQYGAEVSETYTWTLTTADEKVTFVADTATVSVAKGATDGTTYKLKAVGTSNLNKEITITVKDIDVKWDAIKKETTPTITYGDAKSKAFTNNFPIAGTATAGTVQLTGEFTILNPDVLLTKGDAQTITVQFEVKTGEGYVGTKITKNYTVKVNPKPIAGVTVGAIDPVTYTGTVQTPTGLTVTDGSLPALAVTTDYTLTYASNTNAGTAKVTLTGAGNYTGTKEVSFTITKAPLTISSAIVTARDYAAADKTATVSAVTFGSLKNGETLALTTDYTVTASFADANAGANKAVTGTVTLKDTVKNYTLANGALTTTGTINKIAYETSVTAAKNVLSSPFATGNLDYTFDLTNLTGLPTDGGTLGYAYKGIGGTTAALIAADPAPAVPTTTLSFTATPQVKDTTATISVTVSSTNYIDFDAVVTVKSVDKAAATVTVTQADTTYGTALADPVKSQTGANGKNPTWTLSYAGVAPTVYSSATAPTVAGTYTVTATYEDDTYYGTKISANFVIAKKALTITDGTYTATKVFDGTTVAPTATGALGVEGKVGEDVVTLSVTSVPAYGAVDVGSYTLALPVTLDETSAKNYTIPDTYSFTTAAITAKDLSAATITDIVAVTYDNTAKTPAPEAKIALTAAPAPVTSLVKDTDYTVAYSNNTNAGTATVTVTGKGNYTGEKAKDFTINKADRTLTLDKDALTLTLGALTGTVNGTTSTDLDKSAVITYTSANPALATVNRQGAITAVGNGTVNITVAIAAKSNYNEVSKTCVVTAVVKPVTAVVVAGGTAAQLTATVKDTTITVSGMMTAGENLVITPTNAAGVTGDAVTIAAVDAAKLSAGGSYVATITTGAKTVTYTIVTSSVKLIPANVKLPETVPEVAPVPTELPDNANVSAALSDTTKTKLDGLVAAVGNAIDQAVKLLAEKKAELDAAFAGGYEAKVEVFPKITVTGHTSDGATGSLTLDIAPFMQISAVGKGASISNPPVSLQAATQVDNTNLTAPVLVQIAKGSMTLPDDNLFAKHQLAGGKFEYLPVNYDGVTQVYSWWTTSFSSFELYSDTRSATITYTFEDGTTKVVTYTPADIGTSLPSDVKSGNTFSGWTINGVTYTQLTDAALTAINGSYAATGNFTPINNNSGGSVAPKGETVKNPDGSTTTTITDKKTGTVTATTKFPDGSKSVVETKKDGTVATTDTRKDGLKAETVTTPEGVTTATVTVPRNVGSTQVSLPVKDAKPGTIAVLIKADGTKEIIKKSVAKDGKVTFPIDASAKIEIIDNSKSFEDVKENDWFAASVAFASAHELFSGTGEKIFDPTADMNRGMLITVMHRLENLPKGGDVNFDDVPAGAYYAEAAAWAKEAKIVTGTGAGLDPDANVTRESLAVMLYRYAKVEKSTGDLTKFVDGDKISSWAADAMSWAVQAGILQGAGGALNPAGNATRAEVATMMQRFVEFTVK